MIKLKRFNVVKVVDSETKAKELISKGFVRVEEEQEATKKPVSKKKTGDGE